MGGSQASRDTGFFYLTGHRVPPELTARQLAFSQRFFEQPMDRKMESGSVIQRTCAAMIRWNARHSTSIRRPISRRV